jgi:hypothetical protein
MGTASEVCGWSPGGLPRRDVHAGLDPYLCVSRRARQAPRRGSYGDSAKRVRVACACNYMTAQSVSLAGRRSGARGLPYPIENVCATKYLGETPGRWANTLLALAIIQ